MKRRLLTCLLCALPWAAETAAQGTDTLPMYDVEVVLFALLDPRAGSNELWPPRLLQPGLDGVLELPEALGTGAMRVRDAFGRRPVYVAAGLSDARSRPSPGVRAAGVQEAFEALDSAGYRLTGEVASLRRSRLYEVLWHRAWRQPGLAPEDAESVRVCAGQPVLVERALLSPDTGPQPLARGPWLEPADPFDGGRVGALLDWVSGQPLATGATAQPGLAMLRLYPLDGSLRLEMGRYLHIYTDLVYTQPVGILAAGGRAGTAATAGDALQSFAVRNHRRMRSGELHHLDHPLVGMLIMVSRFEAPPPPEPLPPEPGAPADGGAVR